jgi:hypothetical protein
MDFDLLPVCIQTNPEKKVLNEPAYYSGLSILLALFSQFSKTQGSAPLYLNWTAGLSTGWAVLDHGWSEYKERGNFDPEVISFVYLANSLIRGTILPAAILTWIASFGRFNLA